MNAALEKILSKIFPEPAPADLAKFAQYWIQQRQGRLMPRMRDIDPVDIPWALLRIFVLVRGRDGRFAYHLVGDAMDQMLGSRLKGKTAFDVFEPAYARHTDQRWEKAARDKLICYTVSTHLTAGNVPRTSCRIMLPLSDDGDSVDRLIGLAKFDLPTVKDPPEKRNWDDRIVHWTNVLSLD
ncbi:PAS domain-containing protein [Nisaea sp.]|uniref:PAS domain-containing protein n=1 Tax=Nisaea sp. TaxID=2024842 RepID=UPI002B26BB59|nr:PAS domain-containing protein [Nisaea sp.]